MTERSDAHLEPAVIAALVDRTLDPAARAAAEAHLAECADCREVWVETSEMVSEVETATASEPAREVVVAVKRAKKRSWIYAGAGLAAAAAIVAVYGTNLLEDALPAQQRALVLAVAGTRPLEARLSGGFAWGPYRDATRGDASHEASVDVRSVALELERLADRDTSAKVIAARGVGRALTSDLARAVADLEEAQRLAPADPHIASDLSAVYLARAERAGDERAVWLAKAVEAATRATELDSASAEAWFNVALALERSNSTSKAREAWARFLQIEPSGPWADEAQIRLRRLQSGARLNEQPDTQAERERLEDLLFAQWARAWESGRAQEAARLSHDVTAVAEALAIRSGDRFPQEAARELWRDNQSLAELAAGHLAYSRGRHLYLQDNHIHAGREFTRAAGAFSRAGSVFVDAANLQLGLVRYQLREINAASTLLSRTRRRAAKSRFLVLASRAAWLEGLTHMQRGQVTEALASYNEAITGYERLGEAENIVALYTTTADTLRVAGDEEAGWRLVSKALARSEQIRQPIRRHMLFTNAALYSDTSGLPRAAVAFQSASLDAARDRGGAGPVVDSLSRRAAFFGRLGRFREAVADLNEAESLLPKIDDASIRDYLSAQVHSTKAAVYSERAPAAATEAASAAIDFFGDAEPSEVPRLLLLRGRLKQKLGDNSSEADLLRGITLFEARWRTLQGIERRAVYSDQAWELFEELIGRYIDSNRHREAYQLSERARARLSSISSSSDELQTEVGPPALSSTEAALYYCALPNRLILWAHHGSTARMFSLEMPRALLERDVAAYREAIGRDSARANALGSALYDQIVKPAESVIGSAETLVIVPDGPLHALSFSALRDAGTGTYLIERFSLSLAPSWETLQRSRSLARKHQGRPGRVLAVAGSAAEAGLPPLALAADEAASVRRLYADGTVLDGGEATEAALIREASRHAIVHIAAHARAATDSPLNSYLLLAGTGPAARFYGHQVSQMRLQGTRLVVLAACQTATGRVYRGAGALGLAQPFLSAGSAAVVASLWDVDDGQTRDFMLDFHRALGRTGNAAAALREAQLIALKAERSNLKTWAAFLLIGA